MDLLCREPAIDLQPRTLKKNDEETYSAGPPSSESQGVVDTKGLLSEQPRIWGTQKVYRSPYRVPGAVSGLQLLERHTRQRFASGVALTSIY